MPFSSPISQLLGDTHSDIREFLLSACYSAIVSCQYASPTNAIAASIFFRKCCVVSPLFQSGKIERSNRNNFCRAPKKKILLFSGVVELVASKTAVISCVVLRSIVHTQISPYRAICSHIEGCPMPPTHYSFTGIF